MTVSKSGTLRLPRVSGGWERRVSCETRLLTKRWGLCLLALLVVLCRTRVLPRHSRAWPGVKRGSREAAGTGVVWRLAPHSGLSPPSPVLLEGLSSSEKSALLIKTYHVRIERTLYFHPVTFSPLFVIKETAKLKPDRYFSYQKESWEKSPDENKAVFRSEHDSFNKQRLPPGLFKWMRDFMSNKRRIFHVKR